MKNIFCFSLVIMLLTGCSTLKVGMDYDSSYNFNDIRTFTVKHEMKDGEDSFVNKTITKALIKELEDREFNTLFDETPELVFIFSVTVENETQKNKDYEEMGMKYRFGGMMEPLSSYDYKEGSIIINAICPKTQTIVWRAIGVQELDETYTFKEKVDTINQTIKKIMEKFPQTKGKK